MLTIHHLAKSRSNRICWLFNELALEYDIKYYARDSKTGLAPAELKAVHPLGRAPIVTDEKGLVLVESAAIIEYFALQNPQARLHISPDETLYSEYLQWFHFVEGTLMPPLVANIVFSKAKAKKKPLLVNTIANKVIESIGQAYFIPTNLANLNYIESHLASEQAAGREYFLANRLTTIDIMVHFALEAICQKSGTQYPAMQRYVDAIKQRPAWQRAAKNGQF